MKSDTRPIGVFDSGVGGISVLSELVNLMPYENYIYFGDSANAPYGTKTFKEVQALTMATADYLVSSGCKCLVIACNTITAAAVDLLRIVYSDIPIIGIEPAVKPAVEAIPGGNVLVMATSVTLHEEKFHHLMEEYVDKAHIMTIACPGIVEFVERGETSGPNLDAYLRGLLAPYLCEKQHPDAVVLGCTHYPFVKDSIKSILGKKTYIVDGGNGTARETRHQLEAHGICASKANVGKINFNNSDESEIALSKVLYQRLRGN